MTLIEAVVVIFVIAFLAMMLLPAISRPPHHHSYASCVNNLKQIGLAFKICASDNNDKYPMEISVTNGGAMELAAAGNATAIFQVMSNELSTPRVLLCPKDTEHSSADKFDAHFSSTNISYFLGLDANENAPNSILSGDDNLEQSGHPITPGIHGLPATTMFSWSAARHNRSGNLLLTDGSVLSLINSNLVNQLSLTGLATNRLVIP